MQRKWTLRRSSLASKDQSLRRAVASVPDSAFADAAGHPADRKSDDTESTRATINPAATEPQVQRLHRQSLTSAWLSPASTVMSNCGYDRGYVRTPMLRRRDHGFARVKKLLISGAVGATVAGAVEIWFLASLPQQASPPLPGAQPPELSAGVAAGEAGRVASPQSGGASLQPTAQQDGQPAESRIEAPLAQIPAGSAYEKIMASPAEMPEAARLAIPPRNPISRPEPPTIARPQPITTLESQSIAMPSSTPAEKMELPPTAAPGRRSTSASTPIASAELTPTATPESRAIARAESIWIARLGPALESPRINQAPPHLGKATDRASLLLRDTDVRYLSRAELQTLSADQLHIARNEIFARRGRFFKDDALRAHFLQFSWYRPHAWEVPLSLIEQTNVARIQSVEEAIGSAQSTEAPVAASRAIAGPLPAQTNGENGAPLAELGLRYLTREELQGLPADQLAIVRNQIFARRGRYFKDDWLRAYFAQFPWYRPYAWDVPLSPLEQANVKLIQSLEQTAATPRPASRTWRGPPM
jgi:YARHG domain